MKKKRKVIKKKSTLFNKLKKKDKKFLRKICALILGRLSIRIIDLTIDKFVFSIVLDIIMRISNHFF